jgi:hypothetical protein
MSQIETNEKTEKDIKVSCKLAIKNIKLFDSLNLEKLCSY